MRQADCVISLSGYDGDAVREYADVILPIGLFAETDGSFVNANGVWQAMNAAVAPVGDARPAWKVLRVLGNQLELSGFDYMQCESIRSELRAQCPQSTVANLSAGSVEVGTDAGADELWQCVETPMYAIDPLVRRAGALHRTPDGAFGSDNTVELNPSEAERLGVTQGQTVRVGENGQGVELIINIDASIAEGCVRLANTAGLGGVHAPVSIEQLS